MNKYFKIQKLYREKYFKNVAPILEKFEKERKRKLFLAIIICITSIFIEVYLTYIDMYVIHSKTELYKLGLCFIIIAFFSAYSLKKNFENKVKKEIMPIVCRCFGNIRWSEGTGYYNAYYQEINLMPFFNKSSFDDNFYGKYNDVEIEIQEPEFMISVARSCRTIFDGIIIQLKMNKRFNGNTIIKKDSFLHSSPAKNLVRMKIEDVIFEKKFDVFTTNEVEARYLITPLFMERLKNIEKAFNSSFYSCSFYYEHLFIALSTRKDLFSMCSLFKPVNNIKQYAVMCEEILSVIKLVDYFNVYN